MANCSTLPLIVTFTFLIDESSSMTRKRYWAFGARKCDTALFDAQTILTNLPVPKSWAHGVRKIILEGFDNYPRLIQPKDSADPVNINQYSFRFTGDKTYLYNALSNVLGNIARPDSNTNRVHYLYLFTDGWDNSNGEMLWKEKLPVLKRELFQTNTYVFFDSLSNSPSMKNLAADLSAYYFELDTDNLAKRKTSLNTALDCFLKSPTNASDKLDHNFKAPTTQSQNNEHLALDIHPSYPLFHIVSPSVVKLPINGG